MNKLLIIIAITIFYGCVSHPNSNDEVVGIYTSLSGREYHYLQFFKDSTYEQVILGERLDDTLIKIKGEWHLSDTKEGTLFVTNWKRLLSKNSFNNSRHDACLLIANNKIIVSADDYRQNFLKK